MWYNITNERWCLNANEFVKFFIDKYKYKLLWGKPMKKSENWWETIWYKELQQNLIQELENHFDEITVKMVSNCMFFLVRTWEDKWMIWYNDSINKYGIHLIDWVYDVKLNEFFQYTENQLMYIKNTLPYTHKELIWKDSPKEFISFLKSIFAWEPDIQENISFIQEYMWLLLIPNTMFEKWLFIFGSWGNGKWVLLDVIRFVLWDMNCSSAGINELMDKTISYNLIWKLANIDYDVFSQAFLDKEVVKKIISWEQIVSKQLYSQPLPFKPFARILCASNYMPKVRHIDKSVSRRFYFLELRNSFVNNADIHLKEKLLAEKKKIFVWAFIGLKRLIANEKFTIPRQVIDNEHRFLSGR